MNLSLIASYIYVRMRTDEFNYELPETLIAQKSLDERDTCRLLVMDRKTGSVTHEGFRDLLHLLRPDDRLVFNDTRVLPVRLFCKKKTGASVEILFADPLGPRTWRAMARPGRRLPRGTELVVDDDPSLGTLVIQEVLPDGGRIVELRGGDGGSSIMTIIERYGRMPLPPYIKRPADRDDNDRYQTVYAAHSGAVAAPTAGLHFTPGLIAGLKERGVGASFVTLHVGMGTFRPVKVDDPRDHVMHEESYDLPEQAAREIMRTKQEGGRIIAVGTTVVRILEHCGTAAGTLAAAQGRTDLKILPSYAFKIVDGLITNFHLPMSTLLMLVCAFAGTGPVLAAYREAVKEKYRFFSYGDAMFIA
jgi:S-adenosylmethionine:tRNA ribosyltransferase-isomerase